MNVNGDGTGSIVRKDACNAGVGGKRKRRRDGCGE
jgi:hypothetical protein